MNTKCADLTVKKSADHDVAKVLEDAGFTLVLDCATTTEKHYIVAESEDIVSKLEQERVAALDNLRAELHATAEMHADGSYYLRDEWIDEYFNKYRSRQEVANDN